MLKDVSVTSFPSLRILDISGNRIESLELLSRIETKNLKLLNLSANRIAEIRSLSRLPYGSTCSMDLSRS